MIPWRRPSPTSPVKHPNPLRTNSAIPDPVVDLDLKQVPFWQALDAIAEKANSRVDLHARDGIALVKRPAGWKPPPTSHDGLFRSTLSAVTAKLDLETGARTYTAAVEVAWEPHLLPILLETRPQSLVVRDDAGRASPSVGSGQFARPGGRTHFASLRRDVAAVVPFRPQPVRSGRRNSTRSLPPRC